MGNMKKEDPYKEIYYGPDPCYLPSTNSNSAPMARNKPINDGNHSRFKSRSLPPIPLDKTEDAALSYLNYYDAIAENLEGKNQNSKPMVPKEQIFNINVIFESKNVSRCPSVSTVSTVLSSENGPTELNFEEPISTKDTYIMKFTGFLADV